MITIIDESTGEVTIRSSSGEVTHPLASAAGFAAVSRAWIRAGWDAKYVYSFSWMGRPLIQLPDDVVRIQEVIWSLKPTLIIETGVAHGGSLVLYASLLKAMAIEGARVIGVDIEIRPHNRRAIESHPLAGMIKLFEGNSIAPEIVQSVRSEMRPSDTVLVLLDSKHTKDHVLEELRSYAPMVSAGSYIVATDGVMEQVAGGPRTETDWTWNNPKQAALAFAAENPDFVLEEPAWPFNEGVVEDRVTYWPSAYLKRIR